MHVSLSHYTDPVHETAWLKWSHGSEVDNKIIAWKKWQQKSSQVKLSTRLVTNDMCYLRAGVCACCCPTSIKASDAGWSIERLDDAVLTNKFFDSSAGVVQLSNVHHVPAHIFNFLWTTESCVWPYTLKSSVYCSEVKKKGKKVCGYQYVCRKAEKIIKMNRQSKA